MSCSANKNTSIAILAGGRNSRFAGQPKAFIPWQGNALIQNYLSLLKCYTDDLLVISNEPELFFPFTPKVFKDRIPSRGPLSGIHAALTYARRPSVLVVACDMPFLPAHMIPLLTESALANQGRVIIPRYHNIAEPLFSLWPRNMVRLLEEWLETSADLRIRNFTDANQRSYYLDIPEEMLHQTSFMNINTPEDLIRANELYHQQINTDLHED